MSRKFNLGLAFGVIAIVAIIGLLVIFWPRTFALDDNYYGREGLSEIDIDTMRQMIDEHKTFAVFIYQTSCSTSENFEKVLEEFSTRNQIAMEKTSFVEAKNSGLVGELKYYPSFAIYHNGELVDFLDADSDEDTEYYRTVEGFTKWWQQYVQ